MEMINPNLNPAIVNELVIAGTVEGMIAEGMPGTEGRSREELVEIVGRVHGETSALVFSGKMRAADAHAYEWKRIVEELARPVRE